MATLLAKACAATRFGTLKICTSLNNSPRALSSSVSFRGSPVKLSSESSWQGPSQFRVSGVRRVNKRLLVTAGEFEGSLTKGKDLKFAVVVGRFNEIITKPLLAGALETFQKHEVRDADIDVFWVPGTFEIPVVAQHLATSNMYQAVLCIGAVVRGATTHYDAVVNSTAQGIMLASLKSGIPCIFGVLTTENMEQAIDRAGGKAGNKGAEAALTAIEMASLLYHHLGEGANNDAGEDEGANKEIEEGEGANKEVGDGRYSKSWRGWMITKVLPR